MQIREISLKELNVVYEVVLELYPDMDYTTFEDLIYDMRYMQYKMIGIFEKDTIISFAGVCIQTTLKDGRFLKIFDFKTKNCFDKKKYDSILKEYLDDYAKIAMCERVIFEKR